jgi:SAM-dependent methyltransferase
MGMSDTATLSAWAKRASKVRSYLMHRNWVGLKTEVREYLIWKTSPARSAAPAAERPSTLTESSYWDQAMNDSTVALCRTVSWANAANFDQWAMEKMTDGRYIDPMDIILEMLRVPEGQPLRGLVLGCGDMVGEHQTFLDPRLPFAEVDAYDVSLESIERARQLTNAKGLKANYHLDDVNSLQLSPDRYALVLISQSFHHFEQVDHVAEQINRSLLPGGVFCTFDYVGPCHIQFTERQLFFAQQMLQLLPPERRREWYGAVRQKAQSLPLEHFSPDEAICSDQILAAIDRHLDVKWQYNWAGLLFPLLDGIAFNFTSSADDQAFMRFLFTVDYALCSTGEIEPNFTITLATKHLAGA